MYKKLLWSFLLFVATTTQAQLSMTLQVPPEGIIQKPQLWNFVIASSEGSQKQVRITMTMHDAVTNDPIMTATSGSVYVNNGATVLTATELTPIQYEYLSPRVTDLDPNGFLPLGQFTVCYTLSAFGHVSFEEVSEQCITIYVEPLSPPLLSLPFDGSGEEIRTPQFSWIPPAPLNMFNSLNYDFILVEVGQGQTAQEAIQQNMPVYTVNHHPDIFINYPSSGTPLDTGKIYAWQVMANNNNDAVAQSEVWTFKVRQDTPQQTIKIINGMPYVRVKKELDATVAYCEGVLKFIYDNDLADTTVEYSISSLDEEDLGEVMDQDTLAVQSGENMLSIEYLEDERLIDKHTYLLTLMNSNRERWVLKFIYNAPGTTE